MKKILLGSNRELELLIVALMGHSLQGAENIRLHNRCLDAIESIAELGYNDDGTVRIYELDSRGELIVQNGEPIFAGRLKSTPATLELDRPEFQFLKTRVCESTSWNPRQSRVVCKLIDKFDAA